MQFKEGDRVLVKIGAPPYSLIEGIYLKQSTMNCCRSWVKIDDEIYHVETCLLILKKSEEKEMNQMTKSTPIQVYAPSAASMIDAIFSGVLSDVQTQATNPCSEVAVGAEKLNFTQSFLKEMGIKKLVFNGSSTVVFLENGVKGIATCDKNDFFDRQVGFAVAYTIAKAGGNKGRYKKFFERIDKKNSKSKSKSIVIEV